MLNIIHKIKAFAQQSLFKVDPRLQQPLLNDNDIIDLLLRVQNTKSSHQHKRDISFRKAGDVQSQFRGHGMDYEESRQYQPGDDPRYMNWKLSAKTSQHYMKVFREERQPGIFILVDRRSSMRFGTTQRLKVTQAVRATAITAFSAQENNFSIGGVILDSEAEWFKENKNKQSVFDFIHQAARPALPVYAQQHNQLPDLTKTLRILNEILTTGSKVYLISDFFDLNQNSQAILLQLSLSHEVNAIHIIDKAEVELPHAGNVLLKSAITDTHHRINSDALSERNKYQSASDIHLSDIKQLFNDLAIPYQTIFTSDDNVESKITI